MDDTGGARELDEAEKLEQEIARGAAGPPAYRGSSAIPSRSVVTCGCTLDPVTNVRTYCERHEPSRTAKGQALEAMGRAVTLLQRGNQAGLSSLDVVQMRGYLEYAIEKVVAIEELKKARPVKKGAQ